MSYTWTGLWQLPLAEAAGVRTLAVLSLIALKPQPCLLVFHSASLLSSLTLSSSLLSGLGETGSLLSRAVPSPARLFLSSASGTLRWPRMLRQESFFPHGASVPSICLLVPDCLGKLLLPFVCIISKHLHVFSPNQP